MERKNLVRAWQRVQRNQGSPGADGLTVEALTAYLTQHWPVLRAQLLAGTYQPSAVRRVEIPNPGGGMRMLGIPTVVDRFIQQAILQGGQPQIDPTFDVLMGKLAALIPDTRVLRRIRRSLTAGIMADGVVQARHEGTPHGGPLSPLLANVLLDTVDQALERRNHCVVRYAEDCNVYVRSQRAAERVMAGVVRRSAGLQLRVRVAKRAVARAWERSVLGYSFWADPHIRWCGWK